MTDPLLSGLLDRPAVIWAVDVLALGLLAAYHLYLGWMLRYRPERTYHGRSNRLRRAWVEAVRSGQKDILAVQTIRNWVMSATLLGSTSILIGIGVLSVAFQGTDLDHLSRSLSLAPTAHGLVQLKLLLIAAIFFMNFTHFALALRYYNHTGFLINLPDAQFSGCGVALTANTLNRAGGHYNRGTRGFLLALPFVLWLIGPDWFLGGVLVAIWFWWRFDFRSRRDDAADDGHGLIGP